MNSAGDCLLSLDHERTSGITGRTEASIWKQVALVLFLLAILLAQALLFIHESSQTSDEAAHAAAGYAYLKRGAFHLDAEGPPLVKEISAVPLLWLDLEFPWDDYERGTGAFRLGKRFVHENRVRNDRILLAARLPVLILSLVLGWTLFTWSRRLFGTKGAALSLALFVLDPNVVAHSSLVNTDAGAALFCFLTLFGVWLWIDRPSPRRLAFAGAAAGAALASKFTALWLVPVISVLGIVILRSRTQIPRRPHSSRSGLLGPGDPTRTYVAALVKAASVGAAAACTVVAASYAIVGLPWLMHGLSRGLAHSARGHTAYLLGETSTGGWWYYFLLAYVFKTPPGTLLVLAVAVVFACRGRRIGARDEAFLWLPIGCIVLMSCIWGVNIGIRHILPVYPFLCLAAGRLLSAPLARPPGGGDSRLLHAVVIACLAWNGFEAIRIAPHHLAYFSPLVGGPPNGHRLLLDSNLDWGQSSKALSRYVRSERLAAIYCAYSGNSEPAHYDIPCQQIPSIGALIPAARSEIVVPEDAARQVLALSVTAGHFVRVGGRTLYDWFGDRPLLAMPGYTYLVYDITRDGAAHALLAALYLTHQRDQEARTMALRALRYDPGNALARGILARLGAS